MPLATVDELNDAVAKAAEAQKAWGATNPQRRARVMMKFGALINEHMDELAELVSREHGKTLPDGRGDVQRGLEVVEVCMGAPRCSRASSPMMAAPASTSTPCASRLASWPASRPSTFPR